MSNSEVEAFWAGFDEHLAAVVRDCVVESVRDVIVDDLAKSWNLGEALIEALRQEVERLLREREAVT